MYQHALRTDRTSVWKPAFVESGVGQIDELRFGRFRILPRSRVLLRDELVVPIGARAFDLLMALLSARGRVMSKSDLIAWVWPTTTVDESNLRFQMAALRKTLGADRGIIKTIPGRGYFIAQDGDGETYPLRAQIAAVSAPIGTVTSQRILKEALCTLLKAVRYNPDALVTLEGLLSM